MPAAGVPLSMPVPAVVHERHAGRQRAPVRVIVGAGKPVVVTVNVPAMPTVNVVVLALVIAGAWFTVSVNACGAFAPAVFVAVKVIA